MDEEIEFDKLKTKVLKYVLYKKRSEAEIRQKFSECTGEKLECIIEYLKEQNYINDCEYIEKSINEFKRLKNMSIKEVKYKLLAKGVKKDNIDNYIYKHKEEMLDYEINSAKNIFIKKGHLQEEEIINYLKNKGYLGETIRIVKEEL